MKPRSLVPSLVTAVLLIGGCDAQSPLAPARLHRDAAQVQISQDLSRAPLAAQAATHLEGTLGPGALYSIDVPADWNGDLVLYAHGYTLPQLPVGPPTTDNFAQIRAGVLARHFAFAVSSFSENGYVVAEGARQLHQLRGVFSDRIAAPKRTMLLGFSLGGLIALKLAETHPNLYNGSLLVSGVVGGTRAEIQYVGDVRVLFDRLFPCPLPGGITDVPDVPFPQDAVVQCVLGNPTSIGALACTFRDPRFLLPGRNGPEFVQSIVRVLGFHWYAAEDLFDRTHHHQLYDNHDVTYVSCFPGVNTGVVRYTSTPDAENFMEQNYAPDGVLENPVLTMHALFDPLVPAGHETLFRERVEAAGSASNLLQRIPNLYGHTEAFSASDVLAGFDDLMSWLNSGQKPPA
jgi:pimeloyl-ACP methyl ester carboxylesterase